MVRSKLSAICGLKISAVDWTPGNAGIAFENGATLNIYNSFVVPDSSRMATALIGESVTDVTENPDTVTIVFSTGIQLRIGMGADAHTGPEAMQLRMPGQPIVVWN